MIVKRTLLLCCIAAVALAGGSRKSLDLGGRSVLTPSSSSASADTQCEICHTPTAWTTTTFDHAPTGFPLKGVHQRTDCKTCHSQNLETPLPTLCASCHRDPHRGELGQRCEGCHEETGWQPFFTADAHRRTNFPLIGRHALLPCTECHFQIRDRSFSRTTAECVGCHQAQYDRTGLTSINHLTAGFGTSCRNCHQVWQWSPAQFAGHDSCFRISSGPHAGIRCLSCHTSLTQVAQTGSCSTGTAACTACHTHACARTDQQHVNVPGYQCIDRKCYECHQFSARR